MSSPESPEDDEVPGARRRSGRDGRSGSGDRGRAGSGPRGKDGRGAGRSGGARPGRGGGDKRDDRGRGDARERRNGRDQGSDRGPRRPDRRERSREDTRGGERHSGDRRGRSDDRGERHSGDRRGRSDDRGERHSGDRRGRSDERGRSDRRGRSDSRGGRDGQGTNSRRSQRYEPETPEPTNRFDDGTGGERRTGPKKWGGVARRGAYHLGAREEDTSPTFSPEEQAAYEERVARRAAESERREGLRKQAAEAIIRAESGPPKPRGRATNKRPFERQPLPARAPDVDLAVSLSRVLGETEGKKAYRKIKRAASAFEEGRFDDARQILKPLVDAVPGVADVREIYGLTLYRMGRWRQAADQLEQFRVLAGSAEQNAVLADSYRAQKRWADVDALWQELRDQSPSGAAVNEGRIVAAGSLADRGMLKEAIALLEQGWTRPKRPREDHLSRAYALADLYDRAGESTVARELFGWVVGHDPMFSDAAERAQS